MNVVRPFPARVVRQDSARRTVMAMADRLDEQLPGIAIDSNAYGPSEAALYVYGQRHDGDSSTGVVCEVGIQAFLDGRVRGHEAVQPERVEALIRRRVTTAGPPALVTLLHRAGPAFTQTLEAVGRTEPILDFDGPRGVRQTVWRLVDGPTTVALTRELGATDLYIADGHHRVAAALEESRLAGERTGLLCVIHPMHGLRLSAFHRRLTGPVEPTELHALLTADFALRAVAQPPAPTPGSFGMYAGRHWHHLTYRGIRGSGPAALDVAVLDTTFARALNRTTGSRPYTLEIAPAQLTLDQLTQWCDSDGGVLFTLAPPPLEVITGMADAGDVMPPKTTYFAPKPCAGIFLRPGE